MVSKALLVRDVHDLFHPGIEMKRFIDENGEETVVVTVCLYVGNGAWSSLVMTLCAADVYPHDFSDSERTLALLEENGQTDNRSKETMMAFRDASPSAFTAGGSSASRSSGSKRPRSPIKDENVNSTSMKVGRTGGNDEDDVIGSKEAPVHRTDDCVRDERTQPQQSRQDAEIGKTLARDANAAVNSEQQEPVDVGTSQPVTDPQGNNSGGATGAREDNNRAPSEQIAQVPNQQQNDVAGANGNQNNPNVIQPAEDVPNAQNQAPVQVNNPAAETLGSQQLDRGEINLFPELIPALDEAHQRRLVDEPIVLSSDDLPNTPNSYQSAKDVVNAFFPSDNDGK